MLYKTLAISLNYIKYRDTSIIARFYTREFGIQSYIVNRVRVKKSKYKIAHFQPFTLLELVCYHNEKKEIQRISEMKVWEVLHHISFDVGKSGIALFLTEILSKVLKEETADHELYDFIHSSIVKLDELQTGISFFHIQFLLKIGKYLGIVSTLASDIFQETGNSEKQLTNRIQELIDHPYGQHLNFGKDEKNRILENIIRLYQYQFDNLREIKSLEVLKEVMN